MSDEQLFSIPGLELRNYNLYKHWIDFSSITELSIDRSVENFEFENKKVYKKMRNLKVLRASNFDVVQIPAIIFLFPRHKLDFLGIKLPNDH